MKLSAVIPCFGRQDFLDRTLATLLAQTRPLHEIIVVDDGSRPAIRVPDGVQVVRIDRPAEYRGSSAAKNVGATYASGDWLAFSDNDILHHPQAAERVCAFIGKQRRTDLLVNVISIYEDAPTGGLAAALSSGSMVATEQHFGVIHREFFLGLGGYDADTFKDWGLNNQDLCLRVLKAGGRVASNVFLPDGSPLFCRHLLDEKRDSTKAKADFRRKYGADFSHDFLMRSA